jgi:large subunit ribosomal protein L6
MANKKIMEIIELPDGIKAEISEDILKLSREGKENIKKLEYKAKLENNKIILESEKHNKKEKKLIKTTAAIIRSLIEGLKEKYIYRLQICSVHFPMNVSVKGEELIIKNFLGEIKERKAKILNNVEVKVEKEVVLVESSDKEKAGQTAANIEKATRIRNRDRRIFQDGIFIIEKCKGRKK